MSSSILSEKKSLLDKQSADHKHPYVLVIHGGAGTMSRDRSTPEQRATYKAALSKALQAGHAVLNDGGEAMDAAVAAVSAMEGTHMPEHLVIALYLKFGPRLPSVQFRQRGGLQRCWKGSYFMRIYLTTKRPTVS